MVDFDIVFFELDIMSILLMIIFNFMGILKVDEKQYMVLGIYWMMMGWGDFCFFWDFNMYGNIILV